MLARLTQWLCADRGNGNSAITCDYRSVRQRQRVRSAADTVVRVVEQPLLDQSLTRVGSVVEDVTLIKDAEGSADNSLMISRTESEPKLRTEVCPGLVNLLPQSRLKLIEEWRTTGAGSRCKRHIGAQRSRQILIGTIRVDAPSDPSRKRETRSNLPVVGDVSTFTPI